MRRGTPGAVLPETAVAPAPGAPGPEPAGRPALRTEFDFELQRGYLDADGVLHRSGTMRLATARDELLPLYDARVQENAALTTVVLLGRVITRPGTLTSVDSRVVESMFASGGAVPPDPHGRG